MRLYLSDPNPSNASYCSSTHGVLYKVRYSPKHQGSPLLNHPHPAHHHHHHHHHQTATGKNTNTIEIWRSLTALNLPTDQETLWQERHFLDQHPRDPTEPALTLPHSDNEIYEEPRLRPARKSYELTSDGGAHPSLARLQELDDEVPLGQESSGFAKLVEIDLHSFRPAQMRFEDKEWSADELLRERHWLLDNGEEPVCLKPPETFVWTGLGIKGRPVLWKHRLDAQGGLQSAPIAEFHTPLGTSSHAPYLAIKSAGESVLDFIILSFVYFNAATQP